MSNDRTFRVQKDTGDFWNMTYTGDGVRWTRAAEGFDDSTSPLQVPRMPLGPWNCLETLARIADSASRALMSWEFRKQRMLNEVAHEESKRLSWLAEMIGRWGEVHSATSQLDLWVSDYLAREAQETMDALVANKRMALPQAMLYELNLIKNALGSFRSLYLQQFEEALENPEIDLESKVREALPTQKLNMDFVRSLAADPASEWATKVREKSKHGLDSELAEAFRHSDSFMQRLYPSTEIAKSRPLPTPPNPTFLQRLAELITASMPQFHPLEMKSDTWERRDRFRELSLLSSEAWRVKALHSAWLVTSALVQEVSGQSINVQIGSAGLAVQLDSGPERVGIANRPTAAIEAQ